MLTLSSLKSWLTLQETAEQLSLLFKEPVLVKDVLKLALDRHLQLSIYMPNTHLATKWERLMAEEAKTLPSLDGKTTLVCGVKFEDGDFLQRISGTSCQLSGLYDLMLLGAGRIDVEELHLNEVNGPSLEMLSFDGVFVRSDNQEFYQLEVHVSDASGSNFFHPVDAIPNNALIVVRPSSISGLVNRLTSDGNENLSEGKQQTYQVIIAALLKLLTKVPIRNRNQTTVLEDISELYEKPVKGLSEDNLKKEFAAANKALEERLKEG